MTSELARAAAAYTHLMSFPVNTQVILVNRSTGHQVSGHVTLLRTATENSERAGLTMTAVNGAPFDITVADLLDGRYRIATPVDANAGRWLLFDPYGYKAQ